MKTFLSIGSGPGIGLAVATRFAREGFRVVFSARDASRTRELADGLRAQGHTVEARAVDAADPDGVAALVADVEAAFGGLDVLHFNAASMRNQTLEQQPRDTFNADLAVNIGGALAAAQAAAPGMTARGAGSILLTGGGFALQPHPAYLSLSIGKAGVRALAHGIAEPLRAKGVHVATVTVAGFVDDARHAEAVAERFWALHSQPAGAWTVEETYTPGA